MTAVLVLAAVVCNAAIVGEPVEYTADGVTLKGFLAYDDEQVGPRPGVLVVHEWWGHNDYARKRAKMLAELGYTALAVDMYGDGKQAGHPDDAGQFAAAVKNNMGVARARFEAAIRFLQEQKTVDPDRIAAIGYCFGGGVVLEMAREGVDLKGVVSFHGSLGTDHPAEPGKVTARVLVCHGADDQFVSEEQIAVFKNEMETADVRYKFRVYEGAKHSYTNPEADAFAERFELPLGYSAEADAASWKDMTNFLQKCFFTE